MSRPGARTPCAVIAVPVLEPTKPVCGDSSVQRLPRVPEYDWIAPTATEFGSLAGNGIVVAMLLPAAATTITWRFAANASARQYAAFGLAAQFGSGPSKLILSTWAPEFIAQFIA